MDISKKTAFNPKMFQEIITKLSEIDLFKGNWDSIETKEKYSDSSTYASFVGMTTGNPVASMLSKSIVDGRDDFFNLKK